MTRTHIGELGVGAAGKATPLVPPPDLHPLSVRRIAPGATHRQALSARPVGRHEHLRVAGQPPCDLARHRAEHVELGRTFGSGKECHVRMDDHRGPVAAHAAGPASGVLRASSTASRLASTAPSRVALAHLVERVGHALVERRPVPQPFAGPSQQRALHDGVLVIGQNPRNATPTVVETQETARRNHWPAGRTGSAPRSPARGPAWPTSGSPVGRVRRPSRVGPPRPAA